MKLTKTDLWTILLTILFVLFYCLYGAGPF